MMPIGRIILSNFMNIQLSFVVAKVMHFSELTFFVYNFFVKIIPFFLLIVEKTLYLCAEKPCLSF